MRNKTLLSLCIFITGIVLVGCAQPHNHTVAAHYQAFAIENLGNGVYVHRGEHLDIDEGYQGDIQHR